jgi:hypothetical protein
MKTRYEQMASGGIDGYSNFLGDDSEYKDWFGVIGQSRDSNALSRSNFRVALKALGGESESVRVEHFNHWVCGWIEEIYVKPETEAYQRALEIEASLENYPVLDEEDFRNEEQTEADETWRNCYDVKERIKYIREHRDYFEFHDFSDLLHCVRGEYFAGYASELIN